MSSCGEALTQTKKTSPAECRTCSDLYTSDALHYCKNNDRPGALNPQIQWLAAATAGHFGIAPFHTLKVRRLYIKWLLMIDAPHPTDI